MIPRIWTRRFRLCLIAIAAAAATVGWIVAPRL
jgi:hypothetical protein